eukprot:gnl/TRDRNA2_/TRDRNA2_81532_c0_seq1.p1 gnl/TRDRNA2_/TRDRNA2_81532_c0~~gnl/TRDRNA2_/TRDRNA2_81532_c0_seq1.p1  ORF type:complete len:405 (+),score=48.89 gnl/TRDRNA2_/TRDRNA2_81532_c0_seq1:40-1254(+)
MKACAAVVLLAAVSNLPVSVAIRAANSSWATEDLAAPWSSADENRSSSAVRKGIDFLRNFSADPKNLVLNTLSFWAELAETSGDADMRASAQKTASSIARTLDGETLQAIQKGYFGQLFGTRFAVLDALQLLRYEDSLGMLRNDEGDAPRSPLLSAMRKEWRACEACRHPAALPGKGSILTGSFDELLVNAVNAQIVDEAAFRFGLHAPPDYLRETFAKATAPFCPGDDREPTPGGKSWRSKAYLATHVVFVAGGYDRFAISAGDGSVLSHVFAWIRDAFPTALANVHKKHGTELLSEFVAALKDANATEADDVLVRSGARMVASLQRPDGVWGNRSHAGDSAQAYDVLHHVWTALSALRQRRVLDGKYAEHLRQQTDFECEGPSSSKLSLLARQRHVARYTSF